METFPDYPPIYGGQGEVTPRVLVSPFGDNYSQRTGDGLNSLDETWPFTFNMLEPEEYDEIIAFLEAHGGYRAFLFTVPRQSTAKTWICPKWRPKPLPGGRGAVSVTFKRVYDL